MSCIDYNEVIAAWLDKDNYEFKIKNFDHRWLRVDPCDITLEGLVKHRTNGNLKVTKKVNHSYLDSLLEAHKEGKNFEIKSKLSGEWFPTFHAITKEDILNNWESLRVVQKKVKTALSPYKDIPPGSYIRAKDEKNAYHTCWLEETAVYYLAHGRVNKVNAKYLMDQEFQIMKPGKDWEPAYKYK